MANEITIAARVQCVNGNVIERDDDSSYTVNQASQSAATPGFVTIGTTEESETFSELATLGWCKLKNIDATNYVQVGFSAGVYGIRVEAGESCVFRLEPGVTMYLKANTAACKMLIRCYND